MTINPFQHHHKRGGGNAGPASCAQCLEVHVTHNEIPPEGGLMEKISDLIGSTRGIWLLAAIEAVYMTLATIYGFDAYPFAFLTLVLSLIALQFSQIIIVVQNRQGSIIEQKAARERAEVAEDLELDKKLFALMTDMYDRLVTNVEHHEVVDVPEGVAEQKKAPRATRKGTGR